MRTTLTPRRVLLVLLVGVVTLAAGVHFATASIPDPTAPTASFNYTPDQPATSDTITLTSTSAEGILGFPIQSEEWDLNNDGDFSDASGSQVQTSFSSSGPHTVSLRVTDSNGGTDTASTTITVLNREPQASFDVSPQNPATLDQITFTSTSSDPDGSIQSQQWDLDNDGNFNDGSGSQAQTSFAIPGPHTVRLLVIDNEGAQKVAEETVQVGNRAPVAAFGFTPSSPGSGDVVTFTSSSHDPDGTIQSTQWDLDDNGSFESSGAQVTKSFDSPGPHTVTLKVVDDGGTSDTVSHTVQVANLAPTAAFSFAPTSPKTGDTITFTSSSSDLDGSIQSTAWDLDNNGSYESSGTQVTKSFGSPGPHVVNLRVTDDSGDNGFASQTVDVGNRGPSASFNFSPSSPKSGQQVTFTSTSSDPDGSISSVAWDLDNNGTYETSGSQAQTSFGIPGPHTVGLQVTDNDGASATTTRTVQVQNQAPNAAFGFSPSSPKTGQLITFTSSSSDPDGSISSTAWDLDDNGSYETPGTQVQTSFADPGPHTVGLQVTDDNGSSATASQTVQVANQPPTASFNYSPIAPQTGEQITFTSSSSDPDGAIQSTTWDLDNNGSFESSGTQVTKTFGTPGLHTVRLRVTDDIGATDTTFVDVQVANRPPVASFDFSPAAPKTGQQITFTSTSSDPDGSIASTAWDLDGNGSYETSGSQVQQAFSVPGPHVVGLEVTDNSGVSTTTSQTVQAANQLPVASFNFSPAAPKTLEPVTFTSTSTDPENRPLSIAWDLDNNGTFETPGNQAVRTFPLAGTYTVSVQATDADGGVATAPRTVTVANQPPTASFTATPAAPLTGEAVTFTSTSVDPEGQPLATAWDLDNDGTYETSDPPAPKTFAIPGNYTIGLKVTDASGVSVTTTKLITVGNRPPAPTVDHLPKNPQTGQAVTFTAVPNDPENRVKTVTWDVDNDGFDDGTGTTLAPPAYKKPGAYSVRVRVEDQDGGVTIASDTVAVGNRPPVSSFVVLPSTPVAGSPVNLVSTATDPDTALDQWLWDLNGDGSYDDAQGSSAQKIFPAPGTYKVGLKVVDSENVENVSTQDITVQAPAAPAAIAPPSVKTPSFRLLSPFPVVRLAGRISRGGTQLRLLSVNAPAGARVTIVCKGRSCPFRSSARSAANDGVHVSKLLRFRSLERKILRKGVVVTIYVTKAGVIGKFTQFKIRKGKPPARVDSCLAPGTQKPMQCPA